jgi:CheY-like chemotaxis protein
VSVRDNGIGIAADMLPRIFEMFTQVDRASERSHSGLGIGLSLVKRLVEMHGGTVEAASEGPGRGSQFVVRLPILAGNPAGQPPSVVDGQPATVPRRILVVDDNQDSAQSLAMLLKLTGHETRVAYDGLGAVEAAQSFRPDLVLLDLGLPKLSGFEACRQIRDQTWGKRTMMVALTGWGQEEDRCRSRDAGFDDHLVKPVDHAVLTRLLSRLPT